jgi:hypothetical protein
MSLDDLIKLKWNDDIHTTNNNQTTNTNMNTFSYTYDRPLSERQIKRHRQFKGAQGNLTNGLPKYTKNLVTTILKGLEVCDCPVDKSIALVKKYVDARVNRDVNNRDELLRDAWKEIYSLARKQTDLLPRVLDARGPETYHHLFMRHAKPDIDLHL